MCESVSLNKLHTKCPVTAVPVDTVLTADQSPSVCKKVTVKRHLEGDLLQPFNSIPSKTLKCSIAECICIELCCGSGKLSRALKLLGFSVIGIDSSNNRHTCRIRPVCIDLTKDSAFELFASIMSTKMVLYCHSAPPCGTGSEARERPISRELKRQGAPEPKPLRSNLYIRWGFHG